METRNDTRKLTDYIQETYNATVDYTWNHSPSYEVFRHSGNQARFALMANVPRRVIPTSSSDQEFIPIITLKCDPTLIDSLLKEPGFYPAYHMIKGKWITAEIEAVDDEKIKMLVDMSYKATEAKSPGKPERKRTVRRSYPEKLLSDLFDFYLTIDDNYVHNFGEARYQKRLLMQEASKRIDRSDTAFADLLLSTVRQPHQDIIRKYYQEKLPLAVIAKEYNLSSPTIGNKKGKSLSYMRFVWIRLGYPATVQEYHENEEEIKNRIRLDSVIGDLPMSVRVYNSLLRAHVETVEELLAIKTMEQLPHLGPNGWKEVLAIQETVRKILAEREK